MMKLDPNMKAVKRCAEERCRRPIGFIVNARGSKSPVDVPAKTWQDDDPKVKWYDLDGVFHQGAVKGDVGFPSHFSTCANPNRFSRRKETSQ